MKRIGKRRLSSPHEGQPLMMCFTLSKKATTGERRRTSIVWSRSHGALVQPFLKSVATYGERALVFLDGQYSHAVIKKPFDTHMAVSDVKSAAVEATTEEIAVATKALSCVPGQPLFGRVDLLRGDCGEVYVSEVELVEPALYMRIHEPAVEILADAIERELSASAKTASLPAVTVG